MIATLIEWTWVVSTGVGVLAMGWLTREARKDYRRVEHEGERLKLLARIPYTATRAWLIALAAFFLVGVLSLFRPNAQRPLADLVVPILLVGAVAQMVFGVVRAWRDSKHLYLLIEADIRRRLWEEDS